MPVEMKRLGKEVDACGGNKDSQDRQEKQRARREEREAHENQIAGRNQSEAAEASGKEINTAAQEQRKVKSPLKFGLNQIFLEEKHVDCKGNKRKPDCDTQRFAYRIVDAGRHGDCC